VVLIEQAELAFDCHRVIRRVREPGLVVRAPPEESAAVVGPQTEQVAAQEVARGLPVTHHRAHGADLLDEARLAADVGIHPRLGARVQRGADGVEGVLRGVPGMHRVRVGGEQVGVLRLVLNRPTGWFSVHTLFTLRNARLYYTGKDGGVGCYQPNPPAISTSPPCP